MIPVLFDTNIYGKIVSDVSMNDVIENISSSHFQVLNFTLIREELRSTGKQKTFRGRKKLRPVLLSIYDQLVSGAAIPNIRPITSLAHEYYLEYKRLKGGVGKKRIINDFKILACATLKNCDIIVSEDSHLMKGSKSVTACRIVNGKRNLMSPSFLGYKELKRIVNVL